MKDIFVKATMGLGLLVLAAEKAAAQNTNCAPRPRVIDRLTNTFSETRQAIGLGGDNAVIEVFAAPSGTWTIIVTFTNGQTCLVASGQAYETIAEARAPVEDGA